MFKISNGHKNIDPNTVHFTNKTSKITRGLDFTLVTGQNRLAFRQYSFPLVNEWNKSSTDCVHSSSVNYVQEQNRHLSRKGRIHLGS